MLKTQSNDSSGSEKEFPLQKIGDEEFTIVEGDSNREQRKTLTQKITNLLPLQKMKKEHSSPNPSKESESTETTVLRPNNSPELETRKP